MAVNKNGGVPIAVERADTTSTAITAATATSGLKFGSPTVFNTSGTYTIPATATVNSTLMIESMGGGGGGVAPDLLTYAWSTYYGGGYNANITINNGRGGAYAIGIYRLGFFSQTPASGSVTVTVGSGGSGAISNATNFNIGSNQSISFPNLTVATAGGTSSVTYGGANFATAAGGAINNTSDAVVGQATNFIDSTTLGTIAPRGGQSKSSFNFVTNATNTMGGTVNHTGGWGARTEYGDALGNILTSPTTSATVSVTAGGSTTQGTDGSAGTGQGGGGASQHYFAGAGTYNLARAGNGAAPSGGGGGHPTLQLNAANYNINTGQKGGNGGAGRVRIWFQA